MSSQPEAQFLTMEHIIEISNWSQFAERVTHKALAGQWCFRGGLRDWALETSLERAFHDWNLPLDQMQKTEKRLLRQFKRAFVFSAAANAPEEKDTVAWLALMQHHGAPTRLLDWTYSPFVAAYFAMESMLSDRRANEAVVWAVSGEGFTTPDALIHHKGALQKMKHFLEHRDGPSFEAVFLRSRPYRFIYPINPASLNQRLIIQQGLFFCPGDINATFEENLRATDLLLGTRLQIYKFVFPRLLLEEAMAALYRMNMHPAPLFPGLDGYARSLRSRLHFLSNAQLLD